MTTEQAIQLIRTAFVTMTGLPDNALLIADTDMPRPNYEHIALRIRTEEPENYPFRDEDSNLAQATLLRIDFEAYGQNAVDKLILACRRLYLSDDPVLLLLGTSGVGVRTKPSFTNVSALLRTSKEPRYNATITFSYLYTAEVPNPIEASAIVLDAYLDDELEYNETFPIE